jgi:hypothetical protein
MSIEAMKQALEVLEQINQLSVGENAIALPGEIDGAMDNLRAAIEQAEKPMAWFHADNYKTRFTTDPSKEMVGKYWKPLYTVPRQEQPLKINPADCHIRVGKISEPISVGYDQTSLELCKECGWKALIPGDGCLVCARQKASPVWIPRTHLEAAQREPSMCRVEPTKRLPDFVPLYIAPPTITQKPVAWMYDFLSDNRDEVIRDWVTQSQDDIARENGFNVRPLYTAPPAVTQKPVAYADERIHGWPDCFVMEPDPPHTVPLYTAPRQWVGLTDEEMVEIAHRKCWEYKHSSDPAHSHTYKFNYHTLMDFKYAIEAKLKEKNT